MSPFLPVSKEFGQKMPYFKLENFLKNLGKGTAYCPGHSARGHPTYTLPDGATYNLVLLALALFTKSEITYCH